VFVAGMSFLGVAIGRRSVSRAPAPPAMTFAEFQARSFTYVEYGTRAEALEQRKKAYAAIRRVKLRMS
jgi:hypothetical protein